MSGLVEILVISGDVQIRDLLRDTLESIGYGVLVAEDLYVANEVLDSKPVDLILLDNIMVDSPEYRFIRAVRARRMHIPVILITDPVIKFNIDDARAAGVDEFLQRPFRIERVEKVIDEVLTLYDFQQIGIHAFLNKKVLVVDDDDKLRSMLMEALRTYGYNPKGAKDGNEALNVLESEEFDMVISDIRMPEMDGITLMQEIKERNPKTPVVIITGYAQAYTRQKVFEAGADGFISKPFRLRQMEEILRNFLGGIRYG
ncbi:MAG: response regulator [candidate division Zixibacteria bacterium]|nr:response regulator [candidate division Zixibacteria bacterium]